MGTSRPHSTQSKTPDDPALVAPKTLDTPRIIEPGGNTTSKPVLSAPVSAKHHALNTLQEEPL
jgi:hypothetical protein